MKIGLNEGEKLVVFHENDEQEFIMIFAEGNKLKDVSTPQEGYPEKCPHIFESVEVRKTKHIKDPKLDKNTSP